MKPRIIGFISLWIVSVATGYLSRVEWGIVWLPAALKALAHVTAGLALLLMLYSLWCFLWPHLRALLAEPPQSPIDEAPEITGTVKNLAQLLADVERDTSKASLLLLDAQTYAGHLVNLVQAITLKAEGMAVEAEQLEAALAAITSGDPLEIARAAGGVGDAHIRALMLCRAKNSDYWQDTAILISTQRGTLQQWTKGYRVFASNLMGEIAKAKAQLAAAAAALELVGASRPLLQVQDSLEQAAGLLQVQRKPGLREAARQLPPINAGLLK